MSAWVWAGLEVEDYSTNDNCDVVWTEYEPVGVILGPDGSVLRVVEDQRYKFGFVK
mgnify:CR=1 FL=1